MEIYRAICKSAHYEVFGGSCSYDHGRFVFANHIDNLPFIKDDSSVQEIEAFNSAIEEYKFDFIYPAMDGVVTVFAKYRNLIKPIIIAPDYETTLITRSKRKTYTLLKTKMPVPCVFEVGDHIDKFPVFIKPDVGQGSVGAFKIENEKNYLS